MEGLEEIKNFNKKKEIKRMKNIFNQLPKAHAIRDEMLRHKANNMSISKRVQEHQRQLDEVVEFKLAFHGLKVCLERIKENAQQGETRTTCSLYDRQIKLLKLAGYQVKSEPRNSFEEIVSWDNQ